MPTLTFAPASTGGWLALAGESVLLVLTARPDRFAVDEALSAVSGAGGFQLVLDLLTRNGLSATPEFVLVEIADAPRARLVVRGALTLGFEDATGGHELTGAEVSTWAELTVADLVRVRLGSPGAEPVAAAGLLPLTAGAAWVSSLEWRVAGEVAASAAPTRATDTRTREISASDIPPSSSAPASTAPEPAVDPTAHAGDGALPADGRVPDAGEGHQPAEATVTELPTAADGDGGRDGDGDDYDYLFGATMFRTVADAAVRSDDDTDDDTDDTGAETEAEARAGGAAPAGAGDRPAAPAGVGARGAASARDLRDGDGDGDDRDHGHHDTAAAPGDHGGSGSAAPGDHGGSGAAAPGDHDGHTVLGSDIRALRASRDAGRAAGRAETPPAASPPPAVAPSIVLELSTGAREPLGQPVLIGRAPSVSQVSGLRLPRLVTVGGADQDISRNHAQFALEGDSVVVTDLHSRNGTTIRLPGREPQKLRGGEPTTIIVGTLVDFGSGITLTVSET